MIERISKVQEFRDVVDAVIRGQVKQIEASNSRPIDILSYKNVARFGTLTFVSLDKHDARPGTFGFNDEHMWGVSSQTVRILGRTARMAIISLADKPGTLVRRLSIDSSMQMIDVPTQIILEDEDHIDDAVKWVTTPHLANDEFSRLCVIEPHETEEVKTKLEDIDAEQARLYEDLRRIDEMHRVPFSDADDFIL